MNALHPTPNGERAATGSRAPRRSRAQAALPPAGGRIAPRRRRHTGWLAAATAAVLFLIAPPKADARVFQKLGPAERIVERLRDAGGAAVYESDVTINGGRGRLTVTGFVQGADEIARVLRRISGVDPSALTAGGVLNATVGDDSGIVRVLAFHLAPQGRTLVVTIAQSAADYRRSQARPESHPAGAVPPYPDSTPRLFVSDEKVRMSLSVSDTQASAESVQTSMEAQLRRSGWIPLLPEAPGGQQAMRMYARGAETCCVYVGRDPGSGGNVITLLHKQQGIE